MMITPNYAAEQLPDLLRKYMTYSNHYACIVGGWKA